MKRRPQARRLVWCKTAGSFEKIPFIRKLQYENITMSKAIKSKIFQLLEGIEDDMVLNQVMENVAFYTSKNDIVDELTAEQLNELDKAIEEADKKETISWNEFKKEINEWRKK
jgi:hypothetical protein